MTFKVQDRVQRKNEPGSIGVIEAVFTNPQGLTLCRVDFGEDTLTTLPASSLVLHKPKLSSWAQLASGVAGGAEQFRYALTFHRLRHPPSRIAGAFSGARTRFFPYQFKPLLKFLDNGEKRLLIGDDVGLGKTIEAGYILTELQTHQRLDHVLVLVPSRLRTKWKAELRERFHEPFEIVSSAALFSYLRAIGQKEEAPPFRWITSYETLRQEELLKALETTPLPIDLLFVDEAHRVRNRSTLQHESVRLLTTGAEGVVFLSATPVQTQRRDLWVLLNLLAPEEFASEEFFDQKMEENRELLELARQIGALQAPADQAQLRKIASALRGTLASSTSPRKKAVLDQLSKPALSRRQLVELQADVTSLSPIAHIFTRTRKREALEHVPKRDASWTQVDLSDQEFQIYCSVEAMCRQIGMSTTGQAYAYVMMYRAMASCIPAAMSYFAERSGTSLGTDDFEEELDEDPPERISLDATTQLTLRRAVEEFRLMAPADSKLEKLLGELRALWEADGQAPHRKVVLFSFFTRTLDYLEGELKKRGITCRKIHGKIKIDDRETAITEFLERNDVDVLLTSDVGGEGIDLQRASVIFNYDLPWNPMVVEQRIGRIDRIGQQAQRLVIRNFVVNKSIEQRILRRLFDRLQIFVDTIGDIDPILGEKDSVEELTRLALLGRLSEQELDQKLLLHQQAQAKSRHDARQLQERVDTLGAADLALLDEINAVVGEGQLPTEQELLAFLNKTLERSGATIQLPEQATRGRETASLAGLLRDEPPNGADQNSYSVFQRRAATGPITFTLSREVAYRHPSCELFHGHHPFVRWACQHAPPPARAFQMRLPRSAHLAPGCYILLLVAAKLEGVRHQFKLLGAGYSLQDHALLPDDIFTDLLRELRQDAESVCVPLKQEDVDAAEQILVTQVSATVAAWADRENEAESARRHRRRAAIEAGLRQRLTRATQIVEDYQKRSAAPFATRMAEAKRQKAKRALDDVLCQSVLPDALVPSHTDLAVIALEVGALGAHDGLLPSRHRLRHQRQQGHRAQLRRPRG